MEKKHTPGPWEIRVGFDVTGYPCYFIKGVSGDEKRNYERLEANAHIMASAPELLEALKACRLELHWLMKQQSKIAAARCVVEAHDRALAAIAKAEGRSHD